MDITSLIFQSTAFIAAFYIAFVIIRKNVKYLGNKLFVISFILFGLYALVLFLYEFPISIRINEILIGSSLIIIVIGILFFVLSMQIFVQSSIFLKKPITKLIIIISVFVCILTFFFPYRVLQIQPEIEADKNLVSLLTTGIWVFILMIYNSIQLYKTLQNMEDPDKTLKNKITLLLIAQLIGILSPTMSVIGNIAKNLLVHSMMFIFLAIPMVIVGFIISKERD